MTAPWLSLLCPSCRPDDLRRWLESLHTHCVNPLGVEVSLTVEERVDTLERARWGAVREIFVPHGAFSVNELTELCYQQSTAPYIFLSGDDTICRTKDWDLRFKAELQKYPDDVVLIYPNDLIFGRALACYPVTSRLVMDAVPWPVPYQRYAIDDTIFDIVPAERRVYLEDVVMEHLHLVDHPPGHPVQRDGRTMYYPHDVEAMTRDRALYSARQPERDRIRRELADRMTTAVS